MSSIKLIAFKKLKACDSWHSNEFPRKGKGTIRFQYEKLDNSFESFNSFNAFTFSFILLFYLANLFLINKRVLLF